MEVNGIGYIVGIKINIFLVFVRKYIRIGKISLVWIKIIIWNIV